MAMLALLAVLLAVASAPAKHELPFRTLSRHVGFGPPELRMPHAKAERVLKRSLPIEKSFNDACGEGHSVATLAGHTIRIQWADRAPREIEAIFVQLRPEEVTQVVKSIGARLGGGLTRCDTSNFEHLVACFRASPDLLVLAENPPDGAGVRLILEDCTD